MKFLKIITGSLEEKTHLPQFSDSHHFVQPLKSNICSNQTCSLWSNNTKMRLKPGLRPASRCGVHSASRKVTYIPGFEGLASRRREKERKRDGKKGRQRNGEGSKLGRQHPAKYMSGYGLDYNNNRFNIHSFLSCRKVVTSLLQWCTLMLTDKIATFECTFRIKSRNFTDALTNHSSMEYRELDNNVRRMVSP